MPAQPLTWSVERVPDGVLRVAFAGRGGIGSQGNQDGERMREALREVLAEHNPAALVIDLSGFQYRFGDWIASVPVTGLLALGVGRVCVVAVGQTAAALRPLWEMGKFGRLLPLVGEMSEALRYLSGCGEGTGA